MSDQQAQQPTDPVTAFWRDVWARMTPAAGQGAQPGASGIPGMPGIPGFPGMNPSAGAGMPGMQGFPAMMTPEAMRRMQGAYFDAMAQYAEQYMRSPQFLESMKKSMDQALELRRQMDDFLKQNMAEMFEATSGGANTELLGAIRQLERTMTRRLDELSERLTRLETEEADAEARPGASRPARGKNSSR
jgi:uncharacterized protein involved in copper resistance